MWHVWKTQKPMKPEPGHLLWHQNRAEGGGVTPAIEPPHGFAEHSGWRPTNQSLTSAVESRTEYKKKKKKKKKKKPKASSRRTGTHLNSFFHHLLFCAIFFFTAMKMKKNPKIQTSGTRAEPVSVCVSPLLFMGQKQNHTNGPGGAAP